MSRSLMSKPVVTMAKENLLKGQEGKGEKLHEAYYGGVGDTRHGKT